MPGPLEGVRILDVGTAGVGPWAATLLALLGADVVKIESPAGDRHRYQLPLQRGLSTTYTSLNLNKRTAILDLKSPEMAAVRERLLKQADVVMDNLRPGVVDRLGCGFAAAQAINPRLVSASSPAWGESGPLRDIPALDPQVQVFSGFASLNGAAGGPAEMLRYPHLDFNASLYFAATVLLGLLARERSGRGQRVTASHLGSAIAALTSRLAEYFITGELPKRLGSASSAAAPQGYFRCRDGEVLALAVETEEQWHRLCTALGRQDWLDAPAYATMCQRVDAQAALNADIAGVLASEQSRWWLIRFEDAGVPVAMLWDFDRLRYHQQVLANDMLSEIDPPHQGMMVVGTPPWQFSETPTAITIGGAAPDEHHDAIVSEGFGPHAAASTNQFPTEESENVPPLRGVRVLDATQGFAGPYAAALLAEAGAEVIKIEPPAGDYARTFAPASPAGSSAVFDALNRGKQSIMLDLDKPDDLRTYRELAATADIVLEDWGPGAADRRGVGYDAIRRPDLIYGALTAFGEHGPLRDHPASELTMQAWSVYGRNLGLLDDVPIRVGADIVGVSTGVLTAVGLLAALFHRTHTGKGQRVALSQLGAMMMMRTAQWAAITNPDSWQGDTYCNNQVALPRYGYRAADGALYFGLNNATEEQYLGLLEKLGMLNDVIGDPRFGAGGRDAVGFGQHAEALIDVWNRYFQAMPAVEVARLINEHGGMAIEFQDLAQVLAHPQVHALGIIGTDSEGRRFVRPPWIGPWGDPDLAPAPKLGENQVDRRRFMFIA